MHQCLEKKANRCAVAHEQNMGSILEECGDDRSTLLVQYLDVHYLSSICYVIKCETDANTHYISQSTHETKFMFRDFEYTSNSEGLYLYCDATFCETSDYSNQCQQSCNPIGKRSAESRPRLTETVQERIIHNHK
ncbi:hypothetical protein CHS0354_020885 [Potamilus streckersoni]|uniref:ZP domain-containing protein n=1 Tax=Potamilus streckersoni TaxID=2493646 RepID=A0AAE0SFE9_9BIVA|nr:hypothetical protein CHS0354_020885 [Potamilus streckersoni]